MYGVSAYVSVFKMYKVKGLARTRGEDVGVGEGDHGTLLWPELALAAPGSLVALE